MIKSLSEIAQVTMGQSPKSEFYNSNNNGLPFLQGRTTFGDKYPTFDTWTTSWNKEAFSGDILFTVRAPVGDLNIANCKIAIGRGLAAIHPTNVNNKYLYYLLLSNKSKFVNTSSGTIFDSINKNALESIKLNVHDSTIQNHIVNTIGTIDDLIENKTKIINKLKDISTSLYLIYKQKESSNIKKLGDNCDIKTGNLNADANVENGKYKFFTCGSSDLLIDDYKFEGPSIIIAGNGEINVKYYDGKFNAYQRTYVLQPKENLYLFLKECELSVNVLKNNSQGSVIKFITKSMLENIEIRINDNSEIINNKIKSIYESISSTQLEINKLAEIKSLLLSKYF